MTISWESALDLCAEKIQALRHQPSAILHIQGEGAKGILKKATTLFFARLIQTATLTLTPGETDVTLPLDRGIHQTGNPDRE